MWKGTMKMCDCKPDKTQPSAKDINPSMSVSRQMTVQEVLDEHIKRKEQELHELRVLAGCLPREMPDPAGAALIKLLMPLHRM